MKNIITILEEQGITLDDGQKDAINKEVASNYKTIAEVEKKDAKIQALTDKVSATEEALKKFDGIDADGLKAEIENLKGSLAQKDIDFAKQLKDRDFDALLKESITEAKGLNAKAITSLLDVETLKASSNQKEDIAKAIKTLSEAEDSKMLFGSVAEPQGRTTPIGGIRNNLNNNTNSLDDIYKGNPYYRPKN